MKFKQRETWLLAAVDLLTKKLFKPKGYKMPKVRVACGWPSARGLAAKNRTIGQCWSKRASADKATEIFISPFLVHKTTDTWGVVPTLVHELCHASVGVEEKHGKVFGDCARAVGLEGKLTATHAGKDLMALTKTLHKKLGPYPHAKLDAKKSPVKKQTTRLIKCECGECGYVCRTTRKWLEDVGAPLCPAHPKKKMHFDLE